MQLTDARLSPSQSSGAARSQPQPPHALRLRTDDLDEFRSFAEAAQGPHSRVVHGSGPLGADFTVLGVGAIGVGACGMRRTQTVRGTVPRATLHIASAGRQRYKVGRGVLEIQPGTAVFIPARLEFTREAEPSTIIAIDCGDAVLKEVGSRRGAESPKLATSLRTLDLRQPRLAALLALPGMLDAAADSEARWLAGCAPSLLDAMAAAALNDEPGTRPPAPGSRRLAHLEEWIDAHLEEPITLGRLCEVAGVGERALQKDFVARRGMSPMQFLTERRLSAAWRKLADARDEETVSQIALSVGLMHLGRFSQLYRQAYGEPPSSTLQRRPRPR